MEHNNWQVEFIGYRHDLTNTPPHFQWESLNNLTKPERDVIGRVRLDAKNAKTCSKRVETDVCRGLTKARALPSQLCYLLKLPLRPPGATQALSDPATTCSNRLRWTESVVLALCRSLSFLILDLVLVDLEFVDRAKKLRLRNVVGENFSRVRKSDEVQFCWSRTAHSLVNKAL